MTDCLIDTPDGRLRGTRTADVDRFLGVPYAQPPLGRLRLASPVPAGPWSGVRDATTAAPAALQRLDGNQRWLYEPLPAIGEDCLYLNVWRPAGAHAAPVMVWFHGGATRNGHGAAAAFDGSALARRGVVVVTVNYRLGALGGLAHPDLADPDTGHFANWGLQDKLAALRWVRRAIAAFGGDAARVTIAGQSSGAMNVAVIGQVAEAARLYERRIAQSPPLFLPPMFADLDPAAQYTEALARSLGVDVAGLRGLDGATLVQGERAWLALPEVAAKMPRPRTPPVRDGRLIRDWPYHARPTPQPLLIGWTRDEARFWFDLHAADGERLSPLTAPADAAALANAVGRLVGQHYPFAPAPPPDAVIAAYRARTGSTGAGDLWNAIYTDLTFRGPILQFASRQAAAGAPTHVYEFAYELPAPGRGAPHASDVPFVFGTVSHPHLAPKLGAGPRAAALAREVGDAWASFVRGEPPEPADDWPAWQARRPAVRTFGATPRAARDDATTLPDCFAAIGPVTRPADAAP